MGSIHPTMSAVADRCTCLFDWSRLFGKRKRLAADTDSPDVDDNDSGISTEPSRVGNVGNETRRGSYGRISNSLLGVPVPPYLANGHDHSDELAGSRQV